MGDGLPGAPIVDGVMEGSEQGRGMVDERVIVAYDVADDRRRYRLCKALERYGVRLQYSVFELTITGKDLHKLVDDLNDLIDNKVDRLLVLPLCSGCQAGAGRYGNTTSYEPEHTIII
ncbi:MAG TPA: CRISPR-associated endonuclease Cas2 [Alphaproteobacteria bacterium]|nr:CRISPR-associated endonuclease Cas2 [Alphaproteobacteria bacterium]